jgi:hypothetical protein
VIIAAPGSGIFSARSQHPNAYPAAGYGPNFVAEHAQDALTIEMSGTLDGQPDGGRLLRVHLRETPGAERE